VEFLGAILVIQMLLPERKILPQPEEEVGLVDLVAVEEEEGVPVTFPEEVEKAEWKDRAQKEPERKKPREILFKEWSTRLKRC
jgi:hypothetical protein